MSADIVSIAERHPDQEARQKGIELLEIFLAEVRAGNVIEVAVAGVTADGLARTGASRGSRSTAMIGAISRLLFRVQQTCGEEGDL